MRALVPLLLCASACVLPPADQNESPQDARAVDAMFVRRSGDTWHDVDPVAARAASFGRVRPVADALPWRHDVSDQEPMTFPAPARAGAAPPSLSADLVDADPLGARGWR